MRRLIIPTVATLSLALFDCGATPESLRDPTCSTASFNIEGGTVTTFGTSADARKVEAFLRATLNLNTATTQIVDGLRESCAAIGNDLGIAASEYTPSSAGELPAVYTCRRVGREIETILQAGLSANGRLAIDLTPPRCVVEASVAAECAAQCTGSAMVQVPTCRGEVVADCSASCTGSCSGTCSASCTGTCRGTCSGTCMGTCNGTCSGTCSAMDSAGRCTGTCTGTCTGSCSATCMGSCMGTCEAGCTGSCTGQCRGMCTGGVNVRCDGQYEVQADVQCTAACRAQASARATCSEPQLTITVAGNITAAQRARVEALLASLQRNYPRFQANAYRFARLAQADVPAFARSLDGLGSAVTGAGVSAAACVVRAGTVIADVGNRVAASTTVTASFTASVTVSGTAQ